MDDYISNTGWAVFEAHIGQVFDQLVAERNAGQNRRTPMLFHTYAHLVPRPSGAGLGFGPWLQPWLLHYGVPMVDWAALAARRGLAPAWRWGMGLSVLSFACVPWLGAGDAPAFLLVPVRPGAPTASCAWAAPHPANTVAGPPRRGGHAAR